MSCRSTGRHVPPVCLGWCCIARQRRPLLRRIPCLAAGGVCTLSIFRPLTVWISRAPWSGFHALLSVPAPCATFFCVLRAMRRHLEWLRCCLRWISVTHRLAQSGIGAATWISATSGLYPGLYATGCSLPGARPVLLFLSVSPLEFICIRRVRLGHQALRKKTIPQKPFLNY